MGRRITPVPTVSGTVKSIQHLNCTINESGTDTDISITAVSNTNKAYVVENSQMANHYGGFEYGDRDRSSGNASKPHAYLTSTTNVKVQSDELDVFGGYSYGTASATFYGSVIEVT
tara:strand:+ start:584 stop:931 length:348 start_codon:yes stop_codon:yes gene_type:complete